MGYGQFKTAVGEVVADELRPIKERYDDLCKNKDYITKIYTQGAQRAAGMARRTLNKVKRKVGYVDGVL